MKQNDESSAAFLKYLDKRNSDIENINEVDVLSLITDYMTRFEHEY